MEWKSFDEKPEWQTLIWIRKINDEYSMKKVFYGDFEKNKEEKFCKFPNIVKCGYIGKKLEWDHE